MTVLEVITAATGYLEKHGVESPRLNAEHLLAHVLKKKRLDLYMEFDRPLSDTERAPLRPLIKDRGDGKPLQHLLGTVEFYGRTFLCDHRALVPRHETEQLLELILAACPARDGFRALDIGTGSGVIAITMAGERPTWSVTGCDVSPEALSLAGENAAKLSAAVELHEADLFPPAPARWDLIVANLPYIPSGEIPGLSREVRHDPALALDGGADGLDIIHRLLAEAPARLNTGGRIFLEIGDGQSGLVATGMTTHNFQDIKTHKDYQGINRFVSASYG